jgi:hypothetical protein
MKCEVDVLWEEAVLTCPAVYSKVVKRIHQKIPLGKRCNQRQLQLEQVAYSETPGRQRNTIAVSDDGRYFDVL